MGVREKVAAYKRVPFASSKEVVGEWESRAKYPEFGREAETYRVFKFRDGTGTVMVHDGETGEVSTVYLDDMSFQDDEIIGMISEYDFHVRELAPDQFHPPRVREIDKVFRFDGGGEEGTFRYLYVYSDGTGAVAVMDEEEYDVISPPDQFLPLESFEEYFDEGGKWKVTYIK